MARKVKALRKIYYGGREYSPGDRFETYADTEAEAMVLVGTVEYVQDEPVPPKRTRMTVEQVAERAAETDAELPRRYNRRDMRAED